MDTVFYMDTIVGKSCLVKEYFCKNFQSLLSFKSVSSRIKTAKNTMKRLTNFFLMSLCAFFFVGCGSSKSIPMQSASTTYKIGDMYNQNGLKGVVVKIDSDGKHGTIMSLEGSKAKWTSDKKFDFETNAFSEDDGQKNMETISKYVESGNATWEDFPIMNWARSLGEGWYIPSKAEAMEIWKNINEGSDEYKFQLTRFSKNAFQKFDHAQREYGGEKLVDDRYQIGTNEPYLWYTSTENEAGMAYAIQFDNSKASDVLMRGIGSSKFGFNPVPKCPGVSSAYRSRAIHKF